MTHPFKKLLLVHETTIKDWRLYSPTQFQIDSATWNNRLHYTKSI